MEPEDVNVSSHTAAHCFPPEEDTDWKTDSLEPDPSLFSVELRLDSKQGAAGKLEGVVYPQRKVDERQDCHILPAWILPSR